MLNGPVMGPTFTNKEIDAERRRAASPMPHSKEHPGSTRASGHTASRDATEPGRAAAAVPSMRALGTMACRTAMAPRPMQMEVSPARGRRASRSQMSEEDWWRVGRGRGNVTQNQKSQDVPCCVALG